MSTLTPDQVNYLNIGLMLLAGGLAFWRPFELFLFVYAVLGPAHYLTEISWLHDRDYFTTGKRDHLFLIGASVLVTLCVLNVVPGVPPAAVTALTILAFGAALVFAIVRSAGGRAVGIAGVAMVAIVLADLRAAESVFRIFLPTLIHVSIFTGCFILIGALRGRSLSGLLSLLVFLAVPFAFLYGLPGREHYAVSGYVQASYGYLQNDGRFTDGFIGLNHQLLTIFSLHDFGQPAGDIPGFVRGVNAYLYGHPVALAVMAFIAFAYTYHYLNWFSKTSIIQWHRIPRSRSVAVIVVWLASVALAAYDYRLGLQWLFFLSFTHVALEFPLNHLTFMGIGREILGLLRGATAPAAAPALGRSAKRVRPPPRRS
ncbi:MAG TPA: hypothetical protein VIE44_05145 [Methylomirabilota bacterium]|jgi:hypothetical protein